MGCGLSTEEQLKASEKLFNQGDCRAAKRELNLIRIFDKPEFFAQSKVLRGRLAAQEVLHAKNFREAEVAFKRIPRSSIGLEKAKKYFYEAIVDETHSNIANEKNSAALNLLNKLPSAHSSYLNLESEVLLSIEKLRLKDELSKKTGQKRF